MGKEICKAGLELLRRVVWITLGTSYLTDTPSGTLKVVLFSIRVMVYCGKPSKGCLACRSRKTRVRGVTRMSL